MHVFSMYPVFYKCFLLAYGLAIVNAYFSKQIDKYLRSLSLGVFCGRFLYLGVAIIAPSYCMPFVSALTPLPYLFYSSLLSICAIQQYEICFLANFRNARELCFFPNYWKFFVMIWNSVLVLLIAMMVGSAGNIFIQLAGTLWLDLLFFFFFVSALSTVNQSDNRYYDLGFILDGSKIRKNACVVCICQLLQLTINTVSFCSPSLFFRYFIFYQGLFYLAELGTTYIIMQHTVFAVAMGEIGKNGKVRMRTTSTRAASAA